MTLIRLGDHLPRIDDSAFVAPGAQVIGDVELGPQASIWYNCVVRGDANRIRIGARTNIQDGSVIHADGPAGSSMDFPTIIGEDCLIGHMVMLHGATLHDRAYVGLSCVVMNGCVIESDGMLGAGSLLSPGKRIGARELWLGRPAKLVRVMGEEEVAINQIGVMHYVHNAAAHKAALTAQG